MNYKNLFYINTIILTFLSYVYSIEWINDIPIVEETDCVPKCAKNSRCVYNTTEERPYCACKDGYIYHKSTGCEKLYSSRVVCDRTTTNYVPINAGYISYSVICPCKSGYHRKFDNISCIKNKGCEGVKCPAYTKCKTLTNGKWECEPEPGYEIDSVTKLPYTKPLDKDDPKNKVCIPPAVGYPVFNKNGPQSTVCSCPKGMYLTKNKRQCAKLETFPPNHIYTVSLAESTKAFPLKFDVSLEGCFSLHIDQPQDRLVYHSREMVNDLDVNVKIPKDIRSLHFKLTNTTLDIYANDNKNMHPLFSTYFTNVNCKFLFNTILQEEDSSNLIKTATRMDVLAHPRLNKFAV